MWFTGIDWADTHHDILILEESGRQLTSFRVAHTPKGLTELTSRLEAVCGSHNKAAMACIIETNHGYREPKPTRLTPICWPNTADRSWQICGDWSQTVQWLPN